YDGVQYGLAYLDLSTGDFFCTAIEKEQALEDEIKRLSPKEIVITQDLPKDITIKPTLNQMCITQVPPDSTSSLSLKELLEIVYEGKPLNGSLFQEFLVGIGAAKILYDYALATQRTVPPHLNRLTIYRLENFMVIDEIARDNLEIFHGLKDRGKSTSLLGILDNSITPMGSRKLKKWLSYPLLNQVTLTERLDAVEESIEKPVLRGKLRENLKKVNDLERIIGRISLKYATPRDLVAMKDTAAALPYIKQTLSQFVNKQFSHICTHFDTLADIAEKIEVCIVDDPPSSIKDGGIIQEGFSSELDKLLSLSKDGKSWVAKLEVSERKRTGINSLKVGYNRVFGYYIEVTNPHLKNIPPDYIRKQTMVNAERFVTEELKEYESQILTAEEKGKELEYQLFCELRDTIASYANRIRNVADHIGTIDVLILFAENAERYNYCRPTFHEGDHVKIQEGRHPVIERMSLKGGFVPNNTFIDCNENQILIVTGPNMAGKSTLLRQVALIILLAQIGSFVPARSAELPLIDRIFTRIGASDNIARGESTFMVEMKETANILRDATPKSIIILDEIGRGTSTFDGLSIAWAVIEYLHDRKNVKAKTLFATHYHELIEIARTKHGVKNFNVLVSEHNGEVTFLRKLAPGGASRSYGIEVAKIAGLPDEVISRSREVLSNLEMDQLTSYGLPKIATKRQKKKTSPLQKKGLFNI
ncbi:MAG: DNA mismatch repair protein MutS, partial [Thermodesulfobacteriota bacterium]|nr:DNA mismatch repair protein MutS [Thermodesulfobacteriota bacterium]